MATSPSKQASLSSYGCDEIGIFVDGTYGVGEGLGVAMAQIGDATPTFFLAWNCSVIQTNKEINKDGTAAAYKQTNKKLH